MISRSEGQDDLTREIFADFQYVRPETEPKEFKPWHKPRKQFVRREQLSALLLRLYESRQSGDPLRYLGLPGTDLIDLRYLYDQVCRSDDRSLLFLGFNTDAQPGNPAHDQLNVSLHEVRKLPNVDEQSVVLHDDFRRIGNPRSIAWDHTRRLGPFDIVNIDLCDGLGSEPPHDDGSIYRALAQLTAFQARNPNPWLLLVSTRIGAQMFDAEAEQRLFSRFRENVKNCEGFAEACKQLLESDARSIEPATCSKTDLLIVMPTAIGKWLSALAQSSPPDRVELASAHGYRINPVSAQEDLVTLAFRFHPVITAPPDPLSPTAVTYVDECESAKAILKRAARRLDVDAILEKQPDLDEELTRETERLLKSARYDVADYRAWLRT